MAVVVGLLVAACGSAPVATPAPTATAAAPVPPLDHIYVIVMENKEEGHVIGNPDAAFLNDLGARGGLATEYHGVSHPSQPNYLALFAGSTFGVADDGIHDLDAPTIADQLEAAGRTWHVYAQDLPSPCFTGAESNGGVDLVGAPGAYVRKHNPAISFVGISRNPTRCANITDLASFDAGAADLELIVPNLTNDMHNGTITQGDGFLRDLVPRITGDPAFARSLLVVTFDEGSTTSGGGGEVATVLVSPLIAPGTTSAVEHDHYSLLRTIEESWGLGCLAQSCAANSLGEFFSR
ncbi:MAG TPA: alkaline phosphatase family protein [Candidatus Limnocylindrales bacterium]|nr:alkaline phosphatase family protein [Candidatus Limnocylindrales bacterium]